MHWLAYQRVLCDNEINISLKKEWDDMDKFRILEVKESVFANNDKAAE